MRTRRLLTRFVAAAFILMALQQLAAMPAVRTSPRAEQAIARGASGRASARKWKESIPAPAATVVHVLIATPLVLPPQDLPAAASEPFVLRRFQRPPPTV